MEHLVELQRELERKQELIVHYQARLKTVILAEKDSPFEAIGANHGGDCGAMLGCYDSTKARKPKQSKIL